MKQLKIDPKFWDLIVSGKKTMEFRKQSKGLTTGRYEFVSLNQLSCAEYLTNVQKKAGYICPECQHGRSLNCEFPKPKQIFGTANLTPLTINPVLWSHNNKTAYIYAVNRTSKKFFKRTPPQTRHYLDKATMRFVKQNYVNKVDFTAYSISKIKEA